MFYLIVIKINAHYCGGRDLACTVEIYGEDRTNRNYGVSTHV